MKIIIQVTTAFFAVLSTAAFFAVLSTVVGVLDRACYLNLRGGGIPPGLAEPLPADAGYHPASGC
jgi:hypothetical protein